MRTDAFDFVLPQDLIALAPARPRDSSRLLVVPEDGPYRDRVFRDLSDELRPGDLLVRNTTFVIPAALSGMRPARSAAAPDVPVRINLTACAGGREWSAFARPGKRLKLGDEVVFGEQLRAEVVDKGAGAMIRLRFNMDGAALDAAIAEIGAPPLPPYIVDRRGLEDADSDDYQTIYADPQAQDRSVAAPTAGLHFTQAVFDMLAERGIGITDLSLAVGAGTFLPVKAEDTHAHVMHEEVFTVPEAAAQAVNAARALGGRIIAVGTTALRALESSQTDARGRLLATRRATDLFITPGYRFTHVDGLITNFHLPRSTLFMLVCAFAGVDRMRGAYMHAIANGYRFYSYGDSSLLWRAQD